MFLLAIAALGFAFYEVEKERKAEKEGGASTQGCGCSGGSRAADGGVSEEDVMYSVQDRVDPRLRVRH